MSSILQINPVPHCTSPIFLKIMAAFRQVLAIFAVFCLTLTSSTPSSPGVLSKNYVQIAQHFGFPFPKLPNISFANVGKQCKETVEKLSTSRLAYRREYEYLCRFECLMRSVDE